MAAMGFPAWTLIGIGVSIVGALFVLALAVLGQSPRLAGRSGMDRARRERRTRALSAYALAMLVLAAGFFCAGVPLGPLGGASRSTPTPAMSATAESVAGQTPAGPVPTATVPATPRTGAFGGPPATNQPTIAPVQETAGAPLAPTPGATPSVGDNPPAVTAATTQTPRPTVTPSPSPSPSPTATPTLRPTPVVGATAQVTTGGDPVWLKRSPGGQNLVQLANRSTVLLLPGRANYGGELWRQISTLQGDVGWLQEGLLTPS
jgi:hypothetical protein